MTKKVKMIGSELYTYEIYPLIDRYSQFLTTKPLTYAFSVKPEPARELAVSLIETMKLHHGIGLAANQVGIPFRVFVMGAEGVGYAFFNPEILETTGEISFEEGCLSFSGLFLPIKRPETVKIKYQDMAGEWREQTFSGLSARVVLHEYDHMEGIVYTSKVSAYVLDRARRKVPSNLKKLKAQQEKEAKQTIIMQALKNLSKSNT
jgi:peptide deformylase